MSIDVSSLLSAAAAAAGAQQYPAGTLYVVATPIGNLGDMSLRAIHALSLADAVACEDTRHGGALLRHFGLDKPLLALHAHNEAAATAKVCDLLAEGRRVAYVSDAGTPAVSDPGAVLVAAASRAGYRVLPLPGPSSAVTALSVAGDTVGQGFTFVGFLPAKGGERRVALDGVAVSPLTQVLFEAPHRIVALVQGLAERVPSRQVTLCRELTKQFETVATMPAGALPAWLAADANRERGEFVLVLHGQPAANLAATAVAEPVRRLLQALIGTLPLKVAVALVADATGAPRNALYEAALALRADEQGGGNEHDAADDDRAADDPAR